jgi:hypothetical protein
MAGEVTADRALVHGQLEEWFARLDTVLEKSEEAADMLSNIIVGFPDPPSPDPLDKTAIQLALAAANQAAQLQPPDPMDPPPSPQPPPGFTPPNPPEFNPPSPPPGDPGSAPNPPSIPIPNKPSKPGVGYIQPSDLLDVDPTVQFPNPPVFEPPVLDAIYLPSAPDRPTITYSDISGITIPEYNLGEVPEYDGLSSGYLSGKTLQWFEQDYKSTLLDNLIQKLLGDLVNGGYGIEVDDERQLYERALLRQEEARQIAIDEATAQAAARGFELPPGALMLMIDKAIKDSTDQLTELNRDIYLKRSDLYVQNRQFVITQSRELESMMITYWGYRQERALKFAQLSVEIQINIYNAIANVYNMRVQAYKTAVEAYNEQVKAALAPLERDKILLEVSKTQAQVYSAEIDAYKAEIQAALAPLEIVKAKTDVAKASADVYSATMQGVSEEVKIRLTPLEINRFKLEQDRLRLEQEKVKIDVYAAEVNAYKASVDGLNSQASVFASQIQAYKANVEAFSERWRTYGVQVDSEAKRFEAGMKANEGAYKTREMELSQFRSELDVFRSKIDSNKAINDYRADTVKLKLAVIAEQLKAYAQHAAAAAEEFKAINGFNTTVWSQQMSSTNQTFTNVVNAANVMASSYNAIGSTLGSAASTYGQTAASIAAAIEIAN